MDKSEFGLIGLGVMGRNLLLNVADKGFTVSGFDLDESQIRALKAEKTDSQRIEAYSDTKTFLDSLASPRKIMLLVPAGAIVDSVIDSLVPHLNEGDLIIDGGNSHFIDTERREAMLSENGILFLGTGVSGGAQGARKGPSIMPGGSKPAYELITPLFEAISATYNGKPCVAYVGRGGAGNYVKMVHNGIEYAMMQSIAEVYGVFKAYGHSNAKIKSAFEGYQNGRLSSFLISITTKILETKDPQGKGELVDVILDKAKQKGTGKWTSQNAMDLGIAIPSIDMAVSQRALSALKDLRLQLSKRVESAKKPNDWTFKDLETLGEQTLFSAFIAAYSQGLHQIYEASKAYDYGIDLVAVIKLWRGGCIIQSELLNTISESFANETIQHLFESESMKNELLEAFEGLRTFTISALSHRLAVATLGCSLSYFDTLHNGRLPLNLVQAQRDYFGSHTFERIDQPGVFHHDWPQ